MIDQGVLKMDDGGNISVANTANVITTQTDTEM